MNTFYRSGVHRFAVFVVYWTVFLFVAGALVTSNDAALSVPSWPGPLMPPMVGGAFYEHSHRMIAAMLGLLTIALAVVIWVKDNRPWVRRLGVIAVSGVVVQGVLGGAVVRKLLHYWLPVLHACFAQIVFAAVLAIAVFTSKWWIEDRSQLGDRGSPSIRAVAWANAIVIFAQILLGAGFRHGEIPVWPHMAGSLVVTAMVIYTARLLGKRFDDSREFTRARMLLHSVFGIQFLLGIAAYWSRLATADAPQPMPVMITLTVAHTVVGALFFALAIVVVLLCYRLVPRGGEAAVPEPQRVTVG